MTGDSGTAPTADGLRLRRSPDNRVIAGVAGGLGEYLAIDPVVIRIAFVLLTIFGGSGLLLYVVGWIVMPLRPASDPPATPDRTGTDQSPRDRMIFGAILVILGGVWLVNTLLPGYDRLFWPAILIAVGAGVIVYAFRK